MSQEQIGAATDAVKSVAQSHITPVFGDRDRGEGPYSMGSAFLVSSGGKVFVVTAAHVAATMANHYHLGIFGGQGLPPEMLTRDWWVDKHTSEAKAKQGAKQEEEEEPRTEDVAVLDITGFYSGPKIAVATDILVDAGSLSSEQAIFVFGYARNPKPLNDNDLELQMRHEKAKALQLRPLCSPAPFKSDVTELNEWEFAVHFSESDHKDVNGNKISSLIDAKGISGSPVWRIKDTPPLRIPTSLEDLEIIGIATNWSVATGTMLVTRCKAIRELLRIASQSE